MEMIRNTRIYQWIYQMENELFITITTRWCVLGLLLLIFHFIAPYLAIVAKYGAILVITVLFGFMMVKIGVDRFHE